MITVKLTKVNVPDSEDCSTVMKFPFWYDLIIYIDEEYGDEDIYSKSIYDIPTGDAFSMKQGNGFIEVELL